MALTISLTLEFSDPVHWYEQPSSLQASSAPYLVGTKNGLVVTWLTNVNLGLPVSPKMPLAGVPLSDAALDVDLLLPPPHASSRKAVRPTAPPPSAVRRVTLRQRESGVSSSFLSLHSRRSTASWITS